MFMIKIAIFFAKLHVYSCVKQVAPEQGTSEHLLAAMTGDAAGDDFDATAAAAGAPVAKDVVQAKLCKAVARVLGSRDVPEVQGTAMDAD